MYIVNRGEINFDCEVLFEFCSADYSGGGLFINSGIDGIASFSEPVFFFFYFDDFTSHLFLMIDKV
jgi:hypothetical protein